jgi:adenosylhomocysteine nucleosidase
MKIGIIAAMEEEITALRNSAQVDREVEIGKNKFYCGNLFSKEVVMVMCGIGKVNAALAAQSLINNFNVTHIINTGVAGSLREDVKVWDVVISEDTVYHDFDVTSLGYQKGQIPRMDEYIFKADSTLINLATKAASSVESKVHLGRILSGDQFINDGSYKEEIQDKLKGFCVEMEGTAIGHVCYLYNIPFVIIRSISDGADDDAKISFSKFLDVACKNSTAIVENIIQNI